MISLLTKECSACKAFKSINSFYKNRLSPDGFRSRCKQCDKDYKYFYYLDNKIKLREKSKQYRINHKQECFIRCNKWINSNKDKVRAYEKERDAKQVENLSDKYIRKLLRRGGVLSSIDIPIELISIKRIELQIKRELKRNIDECNET